MRKHNEHRAVDDTPHQAPPELKIAITELKAGGVRLTRPACFRTSAFYCCTEVNCPWLSACQEGVSPWTL